MECDNINREDAVYRSTVVALEGDAPSPPGGVFYFLRNKAGRCLSRKTLHRRLPCLTWLRSYNAECLLGDLVAGLTVGLMIIPQALAYGIVAGLTPSDGLYSAFIPCFVYFLLGSTMEMNIGPTAIMALMTYQYSSSGGVVYAVLLCFTSGLIEFVSGVINLGFLINFISQPVISGFTSAAAITIASSQLKALFGLSLKTKGLVDTWVKVFSNIKDFRWQDLTLGLVCIVLLLLLKEVRSIRWPCLDHSSRGLGQRVLKKVIFYLSVGRNALVVIIASVIAYSLDGDDQPFTITGHVEPGIPKASLPAFSTINTNTNETVPFPEIMSDIGIGVVMVPFIAILDHIAIVSAFAKGRTFDATQEIITLGIANLVGSFFGSMPTTGSLSRSAVNLSSGVRTPAGGLVTGVMVLLSLAFLTPAFRYIPKSTLAAVIMCAVIHLIDYSIVMPLWRSKKIDLVPLLVTFIACLMWGLEWGILLGIGLNLSMLLFSIATPSVKVALVPPGKQHGGYVLVTPAHGVSYPSTSHIRATIRKAGLKQAGGSLPVVIDCTFIDTADYTSAKGIKGMVEDFQLRGQTLVFLCMKPRVLQTVAALHDGITVCSSFDALPEALADGETEVGIETVNGDTLHPAGDLVVSTMISTPTSDTSDAANPLLTTTTFLEEK
ncbi:sodium-independent sulfate anion transporter-like [Portunus trituberculatus]|uniref:sodium-independent sulfate anion transporter-like n=1 Tax=Portunus trituberculatus TaxID=210409 RepID=UPI001E1D0B3E|nr:sodium-independent sulfate anion transporter-like [Portunus trituberculatus]